MVEQHSMPPKDWISIWERASAEAAGHPPFEAVYPGPVWESASPFGPAKVGVWKIAVLERRPAAGAEHWGHLFVVLGENASKVVLRPESGLTGNPDRPELEPLPGESGAQWQILIRPRSAETAARLRAFGLEFQRRAVVLARA